MSTRNVKRLTEKKNIKTKGFVNITRSCDIFYFSGSMENNNVSVSVFTFSVSRDHGLILRLGP